MRSITGMTLLHRLFEDAFLQSARGTGLGPKLTSLLYIALDLHLLLFNLSVTFTGLPAM